MHVDTVSLHGFVFHFLSCVKKQWAVRVGSHQVVAWYAGVLGLQQPSGQFAAQGLNRYQQAALQAASQPMLSTSHPHQSSHNYSQAHGGPHGSAVLQVQAALADPAQMSHPGMPAHQSSRQQHEASQGLHFSQGLTQQPEAVTSPAQGLHGAAPEASWQPPAGALMAAAGSQGGEGSTPAGNDSTHTTQCFVQHVYA